MIPAVPFMAISPFPFIFVALAVRADKHRIRVDGTATSAAGSSMCESRTINYITHTLPQSCLTTTWTNSLSPSNEPSLVVISPSINPKIIPWSDALQTTTAASESSLVVATGDAAATPFMSFEDWKEMVLRRAGQDPHELRHRKSNEHQADDRSPPDVGDSGLGEEGEILLSFDNYIDGITESTGDSLEKPNGNTVSESREEAVIFEDGKATMHRSKDAGKTCKERFSYSSFDAGATILKIGPIAKNAKAILVENKDSYMLLECASQNKYVIVELSDDILIDTVVLANFEFFSSMIRHFRVSVSDRYPIKLEKWRNLGTFEAKNSRDIQPFLIPNPQIWAKYLRIEFLTHYGNEYYCPISLLRVHGSRMLDSWKDSETGRDDETTTYDEQFQPTLPYHSDLQASQFTEDMILPAGQDVRKVSSEFGNKFALSLSSSNTNPFNLLTATCAASLVSLDQGWPTSPDLGSFSSRAIPQMRYTNSEERQAATMLKSGGFPRLQMSQTTDVTMAQIFQHAPTATDASSTSRLPPFSESINSAGGAGGGFMSNTGTFTHKATASIVAGNKSRSSGTFSAIVASPTVQEGFFNAITKRLQQVETNLTLSLKYVEDQSRHMSNSLQRTEQKQLTRVSLFLTDLNQTVLAELRNVREQYDQIWQSTVLALESQRDQSERDVIALSSRLNLLADEVVFQKRMAIVQAVLLLSCLFLVIFSRGVAIPYLAPLHEPNTTRPYAVTASSSQHRHHLYSLESDCRQDQSNISVASQATLSSELLDGIAHSRNISPGRLSSSLPPTDSSPKSSGVDHRIVSAEYQHLSPPTTPGMEEDIVYQETHGARLDSQSHHLRRSTSSHLITSRKPLPSLPEYPS